MFAYSKQERRCHRLHRRPFTPFQQRRVKALTLLLPFQCSLISLIVVTPAHWDFHPVIDLQVLQPSTSVPACADHHTHSASHNLLLMSDSYVTVWSTFLIASLPLLKGAENYTSWVDELQWYCNAIDPDYWRILTGEFRQPMIDECIDFMNEGRICADFARMNSVPVEHIIRLHAESIIQTSEMVDFNRSEWNSKSTDVIELLLTTLSPEIRELVSSMYEKDHDCFSDIYLKLRKDYGYSSGAYFTDCVKALQDLQYLPAMNPNTHVEKFKKALAEMSYVRLKVEMQPMSNREMYACFILSIKAHGGRQNWIDSLRPDMNSNTLIRDLIWLFLHNERIEEGKYKK